MLMVRHSRLGVTDKPVVRTASTDYHPDQNLSVPATEPRQVTVMRFDTHGRLFSSCDQPPPAQ